MPIIVSGGSASQIAAFNLTISYLEAGLGAKMLSLEASVDVTINFTTDGNTAWNPATNTINYDPTSGLIVIAADGSIGVQSPALGLYHELWHALVRSWGDRGYGEDFVVTEETAAANMLGEPIRSNYNANGGTVIVTNPTQHTDHSYWKAVNPDGSEIVGSKYDPTQPAPVIHGENGGGGASGGSGGGGGGGSGGTGNTGGGYWNPLPIENNPNSLPVSPAKMLLENNVHEFSDSAQITLVGLIIHDPIV